MPPEIDEDEDILELGPDDQLDADEDGEGDADDDDVSDDAEDDGDGDGDGDDPLSVGFADEEPAKGAGDDNSTIRQMRERLREERRLRLEAERKANAASAAEEIGDEPTMEDCGYDSDLWQAEFKKWQAKKSEADRQAEKQAEADAQIQQSWQQDLATFATKKAALTFDDREEAIAGAEESFDLVQRAVIVKAAADPALFYYALSKSDLKREELAKFKDPIKMAAAVARIEGAIKVTKGRKAPPPDRAASGSAPISRGSDKEMEKLEKEAERTGDRTKIIAYRKKLAERGK